MVIWTGHVTRMGEKRNTYNMLVWKPEAKRALGRPMRRREDNLRMNLMEIRWVWNGFVWLRIGTSGGLLWTQKWTFRFHKRRGISWLAEWLLASQGLCSMSQFTKGLSWHPVVFERMRVKWQISYLSVAWAICRWKVGWL
jgi:hypothetical protein